MSAGDENGDPTVDDNGVHEDGADRSTDEPGLGAWSSRLRARSRAGAVDEGETRGSAPVRNPMADEVEDVPDAAIRIVTTAGREAARSTDGGPGATAYRVVATALLGGSRGSAPLRAACDEFASDPDGAERIAAMSRRALGSIVRDGDGDGSTEVVDAARGSGMLAVIAAFLRALNERRRRVEQDAESITRAAASISGSEGWDEVVERTVVAAAGVTGAAGVTAAALFVPGDEYARFSRVGESAAEGIRIPAHLRVDAGPFADAIASGRTVVLSRAPEDDGVAGFTGAASVVAMALRDGRERPIGVIAVASGDSGVTAPRSIESLRRITGVAEGVLAASQAAARSSRALGALPALAGVAHGAPADVADQLDHLALIAMDATGSDAAVIRVRDAAGRYLDTPAAASVRGEAASDVVGSRTRLEDARDPVECGTTEAELVGAERWETWSAPGTRLLDVLGARTVLALPVRSRFDRGGVVYVVRRTERRFDEVDLACSRIVATHAEHVIDRHVADIQTRRAIDAARSAIRTLGDALVAGVRPERTLRFVPRLFSEMFACSGCRVWRVDAGSSPEPVLVAGNGTFDEEQPRECVARAAEAMLAIELDTSRRPHVAAVSFDDYVGVRMVVEFQLLAGRTLGQEEQQLAIDVATRINEALHSAGRAAAHERQLARVRTLQEAVVEVGDTLDEPHVVQAVTTRIPDLYGAVGSAVFVTGGDGALSAASVIGVPPQLVAAIEQSRTWATDIARDEASDGDPILAISDIATDQRLEPFRGAIEASGIGGGAAIIVPLAGREQTVGLLLMLFADELPAGIDDDRSSLVAFGRQVGSALVNAREYERERVVRERAQRMLEEERENSRQVRALHEVSRTFATSLSLDETMRAVVEAMAHRLDVDAVWIRTPSDRGDQLQVRAFYASQPELNAALERMVQPAVPREDSITHAVMQNRQPVLITGGVPDDRWAGSVMLDRLLPFLQHGSTVAVLPVAIPNEVLGTLTMLSIDPEHALTIDKVDVAAGVTSQAALALDNARLYQQQKNFAEVIQDSLLPGYLPEIPGVELGVLYRSATAGGESAPLIGGDFYDFLELEDGRVALAVGDVTGKGVGAAADTAMTKYIFRALAREHPAPSSFLRYANEVVHEEITPGKFVTLFYAVIDPVRNTVLCGNAGHPEPKLVHPMGPGETTPTIESIGMEGVALGILNDQDYEQREYSFTPGTTLVAYTDGVTEARREGKLYGQFRLERRLADEVGAHAEEIAFAVYEDCAAFADDGLNDDVAIVVVQRSEEQG